MWGFRKDILRSTFRGINCGIVETVHKKHKEDFAWQAESKKGIKKEYGDLESWEKATWGGSETGSHRVERWKVASLIEDSISRGTACGTSGVLIYFLKG